jgi:hypothetical protein
MRAALVATIVLGGCLAPGRYAIERPDLTCERATRVAHRSAVEIGYTVTGLLPARPDRAGEVAVSRSTPGGGTETARVVITCGGKGVVLQPYEGAFLPTYEFSRAFGYSFRTLVQRPDEEEPRANLGLEVQVDALTPHEALLDLDGVPTTPAALLVRVTVRNHTERAVALDPTHIDLVPAAGPAAAPLAGAALEAALTPGPAAARVQAERLAARPIAARATVRGYLVYPAGVYREARIAIEDVETGETEGFVTPVE